MGKQGWMKLDLDWRNDAKVMLFESRHGAAATLNWVSLMCLMQEFGGCIDLDDEAAVMKVRKTLGKTEKTLSAFLAALADVGLINGEWLADLRKVGSERSMRDAKAYRSRRDAARAASDAAAAKRTARAEGAA